VIVTAAERHGRVLSGAGRVEWTTGIASIAVSSGVEFVDRHHLSLAFMIAPCSGIVTTA
jgi:hypothetical protein